MKLVVIVCAFLSVCQAIRLSPAPIRAQVFAADPSAPLNCKDETHWGIWIDGRDAHKGQAAYGKDYNKQIDPIFKIIYAEAETKEEPGMRLLSKIAKLVGEHFSTTGTPHHLTSAVKNCLNKLDKPHFNEVMEEVITLDSVNWHFEGTKGEQLTNLFEKYNARQNAAKEPEEQVSAIAFLVHNLAFAHPLNDHNGRSRLLLIQHELRRLNLGCGTFMYNNNRDMTFNTMKETAGKIKEGMLMYNIWEETGKNPWNKETQKKHRTDFAVDKKLKKCWQAHLDAPEHMHAGTSVE